MRYSQLVLHAAVLVGLSTIAAPASAQESIPAGLRRIDVPVDRLIEVWTQFDRPERPLIAVPRDEFERLLEAARPPLKTPASAVLESAVYEATLAEETLIGGQLRLAVRRDGMRPVWQRLSPWNLALSGVMWSDREAVAGTAPDGRFWLWNDRRQGDLIGTWSARGKAVADRVEFDLRCPEAVSTTLRIRTPQGSRVNLDSGIARRLESSGEAAWDSWELSSSDPTAFRFHVTRPPREAAVEPLVSFRQQLTAEVREDHIRFQARFEAEVWGGETRELRFSIPAAVELYAVSMGPEAVLEWTREMTPGPRHAVRVQLPEPSRGVLRPVLLEGILGSRAFGATVIPQVELVNGLFQSGLQTITVMRPMQLVAVRMTGCRQGAPLIAASDSETLTVEQLLPDSLLTLDLRRPASTVNAQVLSQVNLEPETWIQTSYLLWTTNAGGVFQVAARLPAGWEVTDVDAFNSARGSERITWEKIDESGGTTLIRMEFFQAVTAGQPRLLRILSRQRPSDSVAAIECPMPTPLDCTVQDAVLSLKAQRRFRTMLTGDTSFTEFSPESLSSAWWTQPDWNSLIDEAEPASYYRGTDLSRFGSLRLEPEPLPVACTSETVVELTSAGNVLESYRLAIKPKSTPCERLLVWLSESGPDVNWQVESPSDLSLVARRLPGDQLSLWDLPVQGDLWELQLAPTDAAGIVISAQRSRTQSLPGRAGLPYVPQAQPFAGTVELRANSNAAIEVLPHGLLAISPTSRQSKLARASVPLQWRHQLPGDELRWTSRSTPRVESATLAEMDLRTLVSAPDEPFDYHRALCIIPRNLEALQFRFPAGCDGQSANLNGIDLGSVSDGVVAVPPARKTGPQRLLLSYRTPSRRGFWRCTRRVPAPESAEIVWTSFRWEFSLPPTARLWTEPAGVRLERPLSRPAWTERLFGPFGRSGRESIFWPWSSAAWSRLLDSPSPSRTSPTTTDAGWSPPAGWQNYVAYAPEPPSNLQFVIWRGDRIQLLAWIAVLGSVILGLGMRRANWGFRNQATVLTLAVLLAASWVVDPPLTELIGGLWTGTVVALLVPRRWLERNFMPKTSAEHRPVGSTRSFTLPPLGPVTSTLVLLTISIVQAAEPLLPAAHSGEKVVLVPIDADGQPSRKLPIVYVAADVLRGLRDVADKQFVSTDPAWVFERSVYRVKVGHESPVAIFAAYDVLVAAPETSVTIPLPLRGSGLSSVASCRVDGRPALLSSRPDDGGFQVSLPRPELPVSAIGDLPLTRHTIMVELHRPWRIDGQEAAVAIKIPEIYETRVVMEGSSALQGVRFPLAAGQVQTLEGTSAAAVDYGPVNELSGHWTLTNSTVKPPPMECQLETIEFLTVSPNSLHSRTKTVITPQTGALRQATVKLPPQAVLQDLQSVPPAGYEVRTDAAGFRLIELKFSTEHRQPVTVRCQYVVPKPSQILDFVWQGMAWTSTDPIHWTSKRRVLAIGSISDLRVQPQSVEDSGLAPLALDTARELLEDLIVDVRPKSLYQVSAEHSVPFRCTIAPVQRRLSQWRQQGMLRKDRLAWTMEAVLDPPTLPVYSHVLSVDRRLQIESISVRERNAERVLRWSEARGNSGVNRVTVFLSDPMTEVQNLTLVASLPIPGAGSLPLPNVRLDNADSQKARLDVSADPSWQVEWNSMRGLKRILKPLDSGAVESNGSDSVEAALSSWEYEVQDPDWRATVRLRPFDESAAIRAVHVLQHSSADTVELHSRAEVPAFERSARLFIDLPRPWELQTPLNSTGLQVESLQDEATGWTRLSIAPEVSGPVTLRFQARANWSEFPDRECTLPVIRGAGSRNVRIWLAEVAAPPLSPRLKTASASEISNPPSWAIDWLNELLPMTHGQLWVAPLEEDVSRWPRATQDEEPAPIHVTWLEHRLWRQTSRPESGASLIRLAEPATHLTVRAPEGAQIAAAMVDGRQATILTVQDRDRRLAGADGQPFHEALVLWRSVDAKVMPWSGFVESSWLTLPHAQIEQQAVTIFPSADEVLWPFRGWTQSDWVDRSLQRLESLSDLSTTGNATSNLQWADARLRGDYALAAEKLSQHSDTTHNRQAMHSERWKSIVGRMEEMPPSTSARRSSPAEIGPMIEDLLVDHPAAEYGLLDAESDRTWSWRIDDRGLRMIGASVLFLAATLLLRWLVRPALRDWLRAHPNAAAGLLGLVWWLCLTPSIFGLALVAWSAYRAVTVPRIVASSGTAAA